jgi:hypothetical protein
VVDGTPVAAADVVRVGRCVQVPGCMANAVALELADESDTVHEAIAP